MTLDDYEYNIETDHKSVREHTTLRWTTEPPKETGWYWVRFNGGEIECLSILFDYQGKPFDEDSITYGTGVNLSAVTHYLGPLPKPRAPEL